MINFSLTFSLYILPILRVVLQNMLDCATKLSVCVCIYIYIYIYRERERERESSTLPTGKLNLFNIQSPIQLTPPTLNVYFLELSNSAITKGAIPFMAMNQRKID